MCIRDRKKGREADAVVAANLGKANNNGGRVVAAAAWLTSHGCDDRWLSAAQAAGWLAAWKRERAQARQATNAALGEAPVAWKPPEHLRIGRAWLKPKHALQKVRGHTGRVAADKG
eukprot:9674424-Alexandrium_andersonii.AAC.1